MNYGKSQYSDMGDFYRIHDPELDHQSYIEIKIQKIFEDTPRQWYVGEGGGRENAER
jgi:hypothetical protein